MGNNSAPPLEVLGPDLTTTITNLLFKEDGGVFSYDFKARINHPMSTHSYVTRGLPLPRKPPEVNAKDIGPGKILTGGSWEITAAPAIHAQPYLDSLAYRLDSDEGSIVISGDTGPCESVTKLAKGADILLHNCTGFQDGMDGTPIGDTNTGTKGAAIVARDAGVKTLVMVHATEAFTPPGMAEKAIAEVAEIFKGKIILGTELMRFPVR
jgi:ribonuclease Z